MSTQRPEDPRETELWEQQKRQQGDLLTADEHRAIELAGELWGILVRIVGTGRTRQADLGEAIVHIHALQHIVMAQAAARAYPGRYRLLGGTITVTEAS